MKSTVKKGPVRVEGCSFGEMLSKAMADAEAEAERVSRMTPAQKVQHAEEMKKRDKETEKILKELRGPGFMALSISARRR